MSVWDRIRELMGRAKAGATDIAQVANIKLDIRGLEGRRDHLFREIGRKVYAMRGETRAIAARRACPGDGVAIEEPGEDSMANSMRSPEALWRSRDPERARRAAWP